MTAAIGWMNAAFAAGPSERQSELFATWHLARRRSLPLLVVVFDPADFVRGGAVGGALGEASDPLMAALDAYVPVCATREDLLLLGVRVPDDAWFAIVDTAGVPVEVRTFSVPPAEDRYAAVIACLTAAVGPLPTGAGVPAAAERGRTTWYRERIPGSAWAEVTFCGTLIDGKSLWAGNCGMGAIPVRGARFLWFLEENHR